MGLYILLLGVQGSGKGTQAQFIQERYGIPQVSTGDIFRAMKSRQDDFARRIQEMINAGILVPDSDTNELVRQRLEQPDAQNGVLLDGFPRNEAQAAWLSDYLASRNERINAVILFKLDLYTAFKRAFGRVSSASGEFYNIFYNKDGLEWHAVEDPSNEFPPRIEASLTATGEVLKRRPDDANAAAVIARIDTYLKTTLPLIDYYKKHGVLHEVDAEAAIDEVRAAVATIIDQVK